MKDIKKLYAQLCKKYEFKEVVEHSIIAPDTTTLFTTAGMQQFKDLFANVDYKNTFWNIQPCLRLNDLEQLNDGSHHLYFNMIGLFSFRQLTLQSVIHFFMEFLTVSLEIPEQDLTITIHPDVYDEWILYYKNYSEATFKKDVDCKWSDGGIGGYCTEFYVNDIEIGNIVNPMGNCIDVGFGLERLDSIVNNEVYTEEDMLRITIAKLICAGIKPSANKHGYVLRKLIKIALDKNYSSELHKEIYEAEKKRIEKTKAKYLRFKDKYADKPSEWWLDTHGIDITLIT